MTVVPTLGLEKGGPSAYNTEGVLALILNSAQCKPLTCLAGQCWASVSRKSSVILAIEVWVVWGVYVKRLSAKFHRGIYRFTRHFCAVVRDYSNTEWNKIYMYMYKLNLDSTVLALSGTMLHVVTQTGTVQLWLPTHIIQKNSLPDSAFPFVEGKVGRTTYGRVSSFQTDHVL